MPQNSTMDGERPRNWRNLYGRRRGPKLHPARAKLMEERLGARSIPTEGPLERQALFPSAKALWLEIGFGGGEHLAAMAARYPTVGVIGCEHYLNGVGSALAHIDAAGSDNALLHHGDARDVMDRLPDGAIERIFVLYPDPWPKARHHKRRFIYGENLDAFARIMAPKAELRVASDIEDYISWSVEHLDAHDAFERVEHPLAQAYEDWPGTRYEAKALREGRAPAYLTYRRKNG